jgi:TPP-dependent pyruvate/acetoin dehydrogenase alpha subunit
MSLDNNQMIVLYRNMVRARAFDRALIDGLKDGTNLAFFHSCDGHEAVGVGACSFLRDDDYIFYHHRGHGLPHLIAKGVDPGKLLAEHAGKADGICKGIGGFHAAAPELGVFGYTGTIGSNFPVAVGWGIAAKKNGRGQVVLSFFGDGASNRGTAHEAMNMAACWKLPVVWVCENNLIAQFVPISSAYPREDIADMAFSYDIPGVVVDGMDVVAVHDTTREAVERARAGDGPSLIEAKCYRFRVHSEGRVDYWHTEIRTDDEIKQWRKRDPIETFRSKLLREGIISEGEVEKIDKEATEEVEKARKSLSASPILDATELDDLLYA